MAKCDLCGADCGAHRMVQLLPSYQAGGVVDVCPDCEKWANKLKSDMLLEIGPRMRSAIAERKNAPPVPAAVVWWRKGLRAIGAGFEA